MQEEKKQKWKAFLGKAAIIGVLLAISFATSSVNLADELQNFVKGFFNAAWEYGSNENNMDAVYIKGIHASITQGELLRERELNEILLSDNSESLAIEILEETKTLAYYGDKYGYYVSDKQIEEEISSLKEQLKDADSYKYKALCDEWKNENEFWKLMEEEMEDRLLAERIRQEKLEEYANEEDAESALQEYINSVVEKEQFSVVK